MNISFPQKNTFDTLIANEVQTPIVNNPAGNLTLERSGVSGIVITADYAIFDKNLRIGASKQIVDTALNILINPDDVGGITTLADIASATTINGKSIIDPPFYGVANKEWMPCVLLGELMNYGHLWEVADFSVANSGAGNQRLLYMIPLPTNLYGKKLYVKNVKIAVPAADADDEVTQISVLGLLYAASSSLNDNYDDIDAPENKEITFTAVALDVYDMAAVEIRCTNTNADDLNILTVKAEVYYDT